MAGRQLRSQGSSDGRLFLSPGAPHGTPGRPRPQGPGPAPRLLRRTNRRDPVTLGESGPVRVRRSIGSLLPPSISNVWRNFMKPFRRIVGVTGAEDRPADLTDEVLLAGL